MSVHELKTLPKYYKEVRCGRKPFEIRKNDRNFIVGDTLILKEYENEEYTGAKMIKQITYILTSEEFEGISKGYCVLGIR